MDITPNLAGGPSGVVQDRNPRPVSSMDSFEVRVLRPRRPGWGARARPGPTAAGGGVSSAGHLTFTPSAGREAQPLAGAIDPVRYLPPPPPPPPPPPHLSNTSRCSGDRNSRARGAGHRARTVLRCDQSVSPGRTECSLRAWSGASRARAAPGNARQHPDGDVPRGEEEIRGHGRDAHRDRVCRHRDLYPTAFENGNERGYRGSEGAIRPQALPQRKKQDPRQGLCGPSVTGR
jgi:hypothetical protein